MIRFRILLFVFLLSCTTAFSQKMSVLFNTGEATLSQEEKNRLDSLIYTFHTELNYHVKLIGHTDSVGSYAGNKRLSEKRAAAVRKYLSQKNNVEIVDMTGKAYLYPAGSNRTEDGKTKNRRCEIYITPIKTNPQNWKMPVQSFDINNQKTNVLYTIHGCKIIVEAGSFPAGKDTVNIRVTEYKDPVDFIAGGLPMIYSSQGRTVMYQSEHMLKIEAFLDTVPVSLLKLIRLECPNVDTSNGVKFYEFKGEEIRSMNVSPKLIRGRVEELKPKQDTSITEVKVERKEEKKPIEEVQKIEETSTPDNVSKEPKPVKVKRSRFKIKLDTSRGFELDPDTSRGFISSNNTSYYRQFHFYYRSDNVIDLCRDLQCPQVCDTAEFRELLEHGLQFKNKKFDVPENLDIRTYYSRYKSLSYDGMQLKCEKNPDDMYTVKTSYRKKKFSNKLVLRITSAKDNPEYAPLAKTKWIISYGQQKGSAGMLPKLKVSDFRIFRFDGLDSEHYPKQDHFIELKSDSIFYLIAVKAKKSKRTRLAYLTYEKSYLNRVVSFDDSLKNCIKRKSLNKLYCLYSLTAKLSYSSIGYNHKYCREVVLPPCYPLTFFTHKPCDRYDECHSRDYETCNSFCFAQWIKYYNNNNALFQTELEGIKDSWDKIIKCECPPPDTLEVESYPCYKWEHQDPSAIGNKITFIGLGVYNFDREMALEKKQMIEDAVYLNEQRDTLFKCTTYISRGRKIKSCSHSTYTIIPGFNGLMKHNKPEYLTLLPGKENLLYFTNYNRHYKLYLDLRGVDSYKKKVFILKDITKEAATMDGLREELLNTK